MSGDEYLGLNQFFKDYKLYFLTSRKKPTYLIYDVKRKLHFIKNKDGFKETTNLLIFSEYTSLQILMDDWECDKQREAEKRLENYISKTIILVDDITFKPVEERLVFNSEGMQNFNTYSTPKLLKSFESNDDAGSFPNIKELLMN